MFTIGDVVIYTAHGICKIDDICEKTVAGKTKNYYVLLPKEEQHQLKISVPVDNNEGKILKLMDRDQSVEILDLFKEKEMEWNKNANVRFNAYTKLMNAGERKEIAAVINTLMRKEMEYDLTERKLHQRDSKLLIDAQAILFGEIAITLDITTKDVTKRVLETIKAHQ